MPSIASRTVSLPADKYEPVSTPNQAPSYSSVDSAGMNLEPGMNVTLRSSLPPIFAATDNLRQFYTGGRTPQYRVLPLTPLQKLNTN